MSVGLYIPPGATCHVVDYSAEQIEVVACIPDEGLIVLRDRRVVAWCEIGENVKHIAIFFTYQPWCKYYVLQLKSKILVVSHQTPLKVTHVYESVLKFSIEDFRNVGFPQLGLWKENAENVCITDFSASCALPSANPVETVLNSKVQGLKLSVEKACKQLEEKKRLRRQCMFNILGTAHCDDPRKLSKLVPFAGKPTTCKGSLKFLRHSLAIHHSWQRLLCKKWILGCDVQNQSSQPLRSLSPCVAGSGAEWRIMVRRDGGSPWTRLPADGTLEPGQRATVVGVVPEPVFYGRNPSVEVGGFLSASLADGKEVWTPLPAWRLSVASVLTGELLPFRGPATDHADVLACLACCPVETRLRLEGRIGLHDRVARVLHDAHLRDPDGGPAEALGRWTRMPQLRVGTGPPETPLHGALALVHGLASDECTIRLHVRDARHVFLVVHRLLDGLPQHTRIRAEPQRDDDVDTKDPQTLHRDLLHALEDELRILASPGATPTRAELHPLEMATDRAAQRLRLQHRSVDAVVK